MSLSIRPVIHSELDQFIPELVELLVDTINHVGVPLGFLPPISPAQAERYWQDLKAELDGRNRILLLAMDKGRVVGSGQLALSSVANAYHRSEIQKLLVDQKAMGKGIGRMLMERLEALSREAGRPMVVLQTRQGIAAEKFYLIMGYSIAGVIPGYTTDAAGRRYNTVMFYKEL